MTIPEPDLFEIAQELTARLIAVAPRVALGGASYVHALGIAGVLGEIERGELAPEAVDWRVVRYMIGSLERDFACVRKELN